MIANCITVSRLLFSLAMILFPPSSVIFAVLYLLCGITDVLDGFLARKLHTESKIGERLDSTADMFFVAAYAVKLLPVLRVPVWILIWTVFIALIKIFKILKRYKKDRIFCIEHTASNKLTGILIFLLPMTSRLIDVKYSAAVVCAVATIAAVI